MKSLVIIFFLLLSVFCGFSQSSTTFVEGNISYISSQNFYVKFKTTFGLKINDTLFDNQFIPVLQIKNLSSSSVVCNALSDKKLNINDKIFGKIQNIDKKTIIQQAEKSDTINYNSDTNVNLNKVKINELKQITSGSFSIYTYSNLSNTNMNNTNTANYSLSLSIKNIAETKFSSEMNITFRQESGKWDEVKSNISNGLKIYNLSLKYDINKKSFISFGRKINPNISNIGAIDGLQYEQSLKNYIVGCFIGTRPDYSDYGFNSKLLQFGAYFGHNYFTNNGITQNIIAIAEQKNNSSTDRRFVYFQHSNSIIKNVNLFYSMEVDLYKIENQQKKNTLSLTSSYLSVRYRPFRKLNLSANYDARKNVIYYETYKNYLAQLIDSETRQGFSFQANYTLNQHIFTGGRLGYRFQKSDIRPSKNMNLYITHNNILKTEISTIISATLLETSYLNGNIYNIRFSRYFKNGKYNLGASYSYADYKIANNEIPFRQHIANLDFTAEIIKKLNASVNLEGNYEKPNQFYRLYLQLRKRF